MTTLSNGTTQKEQIKSILKDNVAHVLFIKKDGSERLLKCTLREDLLPAQETTETNQTARKENPDLVHAYDLENAGWRSFRVDSVISVGIDLGDTNGN